MNSRFKFRVWDKYIQGYVKENLGEKYVWIEDDGQLGAGIDDDCILEQCTGLKDKNGNLIYEGDIIFDGYCKRIIKWGGWCWHAESNSAICPLDEFTLKESEIIGNVHE